MTRSFLLSLAAFSILFLSGCATSKSFVTFEILEPADITYPQEVRKIAFVNRAPISKYSFAEKNRRELKGKTLEVIDTMICNNFEKGFLDGRANSGLDYLEDIEVLESRRRDTTGKSTLMSVKFRENLFKYYNLDALVVLEFYEIMVDQSAPYYDYYSAQYVQELMVGARTLWRVYGEGLEKPLDEYLLHDTLYYQNKIGDESSSYFTPSRSVADACYSFGYEYGLRHIPSWHTVSRVIYRGGDKLLTEAADHTDVGDWAAAIKLWKELLDSDNPKLIAKAYNNLAVYYEIEDNLEKAAENIAMAEKYWDTERITAYKSEIDKRLIYKEDILKQFRIKEGED